MYSFASAERSNILCLTKLQIETKTPIQVNPDSIYKPIERPERIRTKLVIPKRLEEALPYAKKPKDNLKRKNKGYVAKRGVIMESDERKKVSFIQALNTLRKEKQAFRKTKKLERRRDKANETAKKEMKLEAARKATKKRQYREDGKRDKQSASKRMKKEAKS